MAKKKQDVVLEGDAVEIAPLTEDELKAQEEDQLRTELLDEEQQSDVMNYLQFEIKEVEEGDERQQLLKKVQKWRRQRAGRPEQEHKSYPWDGASNISVPLAMTNANGIYALLKANLSRRIPFWSVITDDPRRTRQAKALEDLLEKIAESPRHMNIRKKNNGILYDMGSLGTQFVKIPWTYEQWHFKRGRGPSAETVSKLVKNTPELIPIRLEDFLMRPEWGDDLQRAPWCAHKIHLMKHELLQRKARGIYDADAVDKILGDSSDSVDEGRRQEMGRSGVTPGPVDSNDMYDIYEVYLYWDVDKDGIPEDIVVWIHPDTGSFLRMEYNDLGIRPIVRIPYFEIPGELYAMGTGWMTESLQEEIDALHNMRVDGTHISMLQMYVSRRGSGIGPNEEFGPLKHIQVDDPQKDFLPVKFPDIGYGTLQAEYTAKEYADRATGSSDAMMGYESRAAGTRATSSGTMFLAQQGSRIFNAIFESVEDAYSEIGQIVVFQLVRNKDFILEEIPKLVPEEDIEPIKEVLSMNIEDIPTSFTFRVQTTDAQKTEDARRQSILTLFQLYTMGGEKLIQLASAIFNQQAQIPPEVRETMTKFYIGGTKLLDKIMEFFGEEDRKDFLPYVKDLQYMVESIEAMKNQRLMQVKEAQSGGNPSSPQMGAQGPTGGGY